MIDDRNNEMIVRADLHSTKYELFEKYSSHVIHRSYIKRDCQRQTPAGNFITLRILDEFW